MSDQAAVTSQASYRELSQPALVPPHLYAGGLSQDARALMRFEANKKSIGAAYLLWFLVGTLGVHRFYLKRTGSAIGILVLTLLTFPTFGLSFIATIIWLIVDAFLIPGMVEEHNNKLMQMLG